MRKIHFLHFLNAYVIDCTAIPSVFIPYNSLQHSPKHSQESSQYYHSMKDCDNDEMLDNEHLNDWPFENQSGYPVPGLQYMLDSNCNSIPDLLSISDFNTQSESGHSVHVPDLELVVESDCNSIPDMLSISDSDSCGESRHSMPNLESAVESDCDSIPNLLSISDSDVQGEFRHSVPDLELVVESNYESLVVSVMDHHSSESDHDESGDERST